MSLQNLQSELDLFHHIDISDSNDSQLNQAEFLDITFDLFRPIIDLRILNSMRGDENVPVRPIFNGLFLRLPFSFSGPTDNNTFSFPQSEWSSMKQNIINLKTEKYNEEKCTCSLCLDEIEKGSDIYRLTCNHVFHSHNCLGDRNVIDWLKKNDTCPNCRTKFVSPLCGNENGLDADEIQTVMKQAEVSREIAVKALRKHGNIVDAILECAKPRASEPVNEDGLAPEDIELVMEQAEVSREIVVKALRKHRNIVDAILDCTP
jgi:NACalpha-BTF3-like transcription factor